MKVSVTSKEKVAELVEASSYRADRHQLLQGQWVQNSLVDTS